MKPSTGIARATSKYAHKDGSRCRKRNAKEALTVGGINPTIQLAAALDRRGVTVSIDHDRLRVHIEGHSHMLIQPLPERRNTYDYGREWTWTYGGHAGVHPRGDYEGAADAVVKFLTSNPALDGTRCRYRIDHMGMSFEEETREALARGKKTTGKR